jgi:hypothetical protein
MDPLAVATWRTSTSIEEKKEHLETPAMSDFDPAHSER